MPIDLNRQRRTYSYTRVQPRYQEAQVIVDETLDWKNSVRAVSDGEYLLSGPSSTITMDGVTIVDGDRVLLRSQDDASQNGIYYFQVTDGNYSLIRASDATQETLSCGAATYVEEGSKAGKIYILSTTNPITVGSTLLYWSEFSGGGGGTPGGSNTFVQFNDGGSFGGVSGLKFNKTTGALTGTYVLASTGFSGSLTRLTDGTSYLIAGDNVTINTGSKGEVTISSVGGAGGKDYWVSTTAESIYSTGSVAIRGGLSSVDSATDIGADVFFFVSGSITGSGTNDKKAVFGGDVKMSGSLEVSGDQVEITGSLRVTNGISGSLTRLTDDTPYLIAGPNITINTGSNGAVQITGSAGGGGVSGTGTAYKHARFSAASTIESSLLEDGIGEGPTGLPFPLVPNFLTSSAEGFHFPSAQRWTVAPSNTRALVINENGFVFNASARSVGIGTANPANPLHITHTSFGSYSAFISDSMQTIRLQNTSTTAGNSTSIVNIGNVGIGNSDINAHISFVNLDADSAAITFGTKQNASSFGERMRIDEAGNVGIGTGIYTGRLYVSGSSTGTTPTLAVRHGVANGSSLPVLNVQNSAGDSLLYVSGSGFVGIGTTTQSALADLVIGTGATIVSVASSGVGSFPGAGILFEVNNTLSGAILVSDAGMMVGGGAGRELLLNSDNDTKVVVTPGGLVRIIDNDSYFDADVNSGQGIKLASSPGNADAQVLDAYYEADLSAVIDCSGNDGNGVYVLDVAYDTLKMTRVGRLVTIGGDLRIDSLGDTPSGRLYILLGTTSGQYPSMDTAASVYVTGATDLSGAFASSIQAYVEASTDKMYIDGYLDGSKVDIATQVAAGVTIKISVTYAV